MFFFARRGLVGAVGLSFKGPERDGSFLVRQQSSGPEAFAAGNKKEIFRVRGGGNAALLYHVGVVFCWLNFWDGIQSIYMYVA